MHPRNNCIFYTDRGLCNHLDRGRGIFGNGLKCVEITEFKVICRQKLKHKRPQPPYKL